MNVDSLMDTLKKRFSPSAVASNPHFDPALVIIRMPETETITGLKRPTIYKRLKDDPTFPKPIPLSNSTARGAPIGFVLAEVQEWVRSRIACREEQTHISPQVNGPLLNERIELEHQAGLPLQGSAHQREVAE